MVERRRKLLEDHDHEERYLLITVEGHAVPDLRVWGYTAVPRGRVICLVKAEMTSESDNADDGDSGAPIFKIASSGNAKIVGILAGRHADDPDERLLFSYIGQIYAELGKNVSWNTCTSAVSSLKHINVQLEALEALVVSLP